ncbi:MAG: PRTRC system ThiF family protein [Bryobacterales bacterium]|jgi:PRTRC genetic system ThiF family protein|nr:PRTRC system ThiF family protein [Bryobacterales bacterium]
MHTLDPELLRRCVRVLLIGCGGSGSAIASGLPYLHQAMIVAGHPGGLHVTVMDGDVISATNCVRQPFCSSEIGLYKAVVMVSRLNLFWGLNWSTVPEYLTSQTDLSNFDIVIGCVDTRAARQVIHAKVQGMRSRVAYWLDLGNSADSGQFVMGQPLNSRNRRSAQRLPTAPELFPEIIEASLDNDGAPSCSAIEALDRQEPFVNQALAFHALALLTRLFRYGQIDHQGAFVNVRENRVHPLAINATTWHKLRRRGRRLLAAA